MSRCGNLVGEKFGKLTVVARAENTANGKARWICKCDCGKTKKLPVLTNDLRNGSVRSCGCLYFESNAGRNKRHGMTNTRLHRIWSGMISRCNNHPRYKNIKVCDDWKRFETFYEWSINNGYSDSLTIDRIDNNGDYTPSNCRWATYKVQENNRSDIRKFVYKGHTYTTTELAEMLNISSATLIWRINHNWPESDLRLPPNLANKVIRGKVHESE